MDNETYYKRIKGDRISEHEELINHCIGELVKNGEIQHEVPKIHKIHNPGRPFISSVNSHTEKISARVHECLRPIVERLPLYQGRDRLHSSGQTSFNE